MKFLHFPIMEGLRDMMLIRNFIQLIVGTIIAIRGEKRDQTPVDISGRGYFMSFFPCIVDNF
jgi:hypothetical protein